MDSNVVVALIAFAGSAIGTFGGILTSQKLTQYRIGQLEKKVDEYNNVKTRTTELETWRDSVDSEISELKKKISNLESLHMKS
jgi:peptidoglycan hydrolase CwlO-like protein